MFVFEEMDPMYNVFYPLDVNGLWHLSPQIYPNYQFNNLQTLILMNFRPTSSDKVSLTGIIHFNFLIDFGNPFNPSLDF